MISKVVIVMFVNLLFQLLIIKSRPLEHSNMFHLKQSPLYGTTRLGPGWQLPSLTMCSKACLETYRERCISFMYNLSNNLCIPGAIMNSTEPEPSPEEGELYLLQLPCEDDLGFKVYSHNETNLCLGVFTQELNYSLADSECRSKDSFLVSLKDWDTVAIMGNYVDSQISSAWVGCNDLETESEFRWKEDGSKVTNLWIFNEYEPNNAGGGEDCCQYTTGSDRINDNSCGNEYSFVCQKIYQ